MYEIFSRYYDIKINHLHIYNILPPAKYFKDDFQQKRHAFDCGGTGVHHHNEVSERSIQTLTYWERTMVIHAALDWPEESQKSLCPFDIVYAVWI